MMKGFFATAGRMLVTLAVVGVAIVVGWQLWRYYMLEPWTRDGRIRADVVTVAADVSGLVSDVFVQDNEKVGKGQPLFRIDQRRFQYALDQAKAELASRQTTLNQNKRDLARAEHLTTLAITAQQVEHDQQAVDVAQAQLDAANAALEVAQLNLSSVRRYRRPLEPGRREAHSASAGYRYKSLNGRRPRTLNNS